VTGADAPVVLALWRGCVFQVAAGVQPPKAGSLLFSRSIAVRPGERMLELGVGLGLASVIAAKAGARVVATDVVREAVEAARVNALMNGVTLDLRVGDCYAPVAGERFDLVCSSPPQMPTPPDRERDDAVAAADNGGRDGWSMLDRVIAGAPDHLVPGGRLLFSMFGFLGVKTAFAKLEARGLRPSVVAHEAQGFPRLGYERLDHIRSLDREGTLPADRQPVKVDRYIIQGVLSR
jgi:release factor glutamine methyltransferase